VLDASRDPRLLHEWTELEREALEPNLFFAQQPVLPAARHLEAGTSVSLLIGEAGARLPFLLPVVPLRPAVVRGGSPAPVMGARLLLSRHAAALPPRRPRPDLDGGPVRTLTCRSATLLVMRLHSGDGPVAAALSRPMPTGLRPQAGFDYRPWVRAPPSHPDLRHRVDRQKDLANFARRRRQLRQTLEAGIDTADRTAAGLDEAIEEFLRLEASGWKGRTGTAMLCRPGHDRFFREVCRGFAEEGRLMFLGLQAEGQVLAFSTALLAGRGLFGFKKAHDEAFARWLPGTLLDLDVLAWFQEMRDLDWLDTCSSRTSWQGDAVRRLSTDPDALAPVRRGGPGRRGDDHRLPTSTRLPARDRDRRGPRLSNRRSG
jgi:hypothetical protein